MAHEPKKKMLKNGKSQVNSFVIVGSPRSKNKLVIYADINWTIEISTVKCPYLEKLILWLKKGEFVGFSSIAWSELGAELYNFFGRKKWRC